MAAFVTTRARAQWADEIREWGFQDFANRAYRERDHHRQRWIDKLWEHDVVRSYAFQVEDHHWDVTSPDGAPLFVAGTLWDEFAAEL